MATLHDNQWAAIRTAWEFDPDEPSYNVAAARAGEKFHFAPPAKSSIDARAKRENWIRRGNLNGINSAAQRKADTKTTSDGTSVANAGKAQASREESEDVRAEVLVRHRSEWPAITAMVKEVIDTRNTDPPGAFSKAKLAKTAAETLKIKQDGERKAWGLDEVQNVGDLSNLSDAELEAMTKCAKTLKY